MDNIRKLLRCNAWWVLGVPRPAGKGVMDEHLWLGVGKLATPASDAPATTACTCHLLRLDNLNPPIDIIAPTIHKCTVGFLRLDE